MKVESILADSHFQALKAEIIELTGLAYYLAKEPELAARLSRRFENLGIRSLADYQKMLREDKTEVDKLADLLTIGETYFFRHREQFEGLRKVIIPELIEKRRQQKTLSIWCAGCSQGAEPYSIGILLNREFSFQLQDWNVQILGTDINPQALAKAEEGLFDDWHMRDMQADMRELCFTREGKSWRIRPQYKTYVNFAQHNLVSDGFPPKAMQMRTIDIILCRNVMIYFTPATIATIMPRFERCLADDGWMLLGYSEIQTETYTDFQVVPFPGALAFKKKKAFAPNPTPAISFKTPEPPRTPPPVARPASAVTSQTVPFKADSPTQPAGAPSLHDRFLSLAGAQDFNAALAICEQMIALNNIDERAYYLRGLTLLQLHRIVDAEQAFHKAIYLNRRFIMAHYYQGLVCQQLAQGEKSRRHLANALALLEKLPQGQTIPEGEGMTASDLSKILKARGVAA